MTHRVTGRQQGFTIVELLIATLVFSVVLLLVTAGILQVTRVYYQGVTESNTQNTARSIMDTITQSIQFDGGTITPPPSNPTAGAQAYFCIGSQEFIYYPGYQLVDGAPGVHQTNHALVQQPFSGNCSAPPLGGLTGRELLGPHMRLSNVVITDLGSNLYQVRVLIVYGNDDLLNNPTSTNPSIPPSCIGKQAGTQFCAVANLSSVVVKRVQ